MWSVFDPNNVPSGSAGRDASLLATSPERFPGFPHPYNINPEHYPHKHIYVGCVNDLQTDQRRYYNKTVPKEDREKMTPDVCLDFCTKVNGTQFYALHDGTGCYCTPFFRNNTEINDALRGWNCAKPCEGDKATMCGGEHMVSMWSVFDPNNLPSGSAGRDASTASGLAMLALPGLDEMTEFEAGGCSTGNAMHLPAQYTRAECRIECAKDPLCTAAEMPSSTLVHAETRGWCALLYHSDSYASNNNSICAHKMSRMMHFQTGACGRPGPDGNTFSDTHHDGWAGTEGTHVPGGPYTPQECLQKCALDADCDSAEQSKAQLASSGKSWCALFYTTSAIARNGVAPNEKFNCAVKEFGKPVVATTTMMDFTTGICGMQTGQGGFQDLHQSVDGRVGQEGSHLEGTYTPQECKNKCLEDNRCMGARQPTELNEHGKAWCVLLHHSEAVTEIGADANAKFKCALKSFPSLPQVW
jgi:hypothetical protein